MKTIILPIFFLLLVGTSPLFAQPGTNTFDAEKMLPHKIVVKVKEGVNFNYSLQRNLQRLPFQLNSSKQLHPSEEKRSIKKGLVAESKRKRNISKFGIIVFMSLKLKVVTSSLH